jgi:hypothetical protein
MNKMISYAKYALLHQITKMSDVAFIAVSDYVRDVSQNINLIIKFKIKNVRFVNKMMD